VTVTPIDDTLFEGAEEIQMTLRPGEGYALGVPSRAVMPFSDNDAPDEGVGTIQFARSSFGAAEGAGTVTVIVERVGGTQGNVGVRYATAGGSATPGADFQSTSGELAWRAGESGPKTFTVAIVDDSQVEGPETFQVNLSTPTGGAALGLSTVGVTITDNDVAGPCGSTGNAWTNNAGSYACTGTCDPCHSPQVITVNGDVVTVTPFHAGGAASFQGCGESVQSQSSTLTFFGQANHRATLTRNGDRRFSALIQSSGGGTCQLTCFR
jgi:hypothetical protein